MSLASTLGGVASVLGTATGQPWLAAGGAALSAYGANQERKDAAEQAQAFSAQQAATSYQRAVADMKAAGLNPMLAAMKGGAPAAQGIVPNLSDISTGVSSAAESVARQPTYEASVAESYARIPTYEASVALTKAQQHQVLVNTEKIAEEIKNIPLEGRRLEKVAELLFAQTVETAQKTRNLYETEKQIQATVEQVKVRTGIDAAELQAIMGTGNFRRFAEQFGPIGNIVGSAVDAAIGAKRAGTYDRGTPTRRK